MLFDSKAVVDVEIGMLCDSIVDCEVVGSGVLCGSKAVVEVGVGMLYDSIVDCEGVVVAGGGVRCDRDAAHAFAGSIDSAEYGGSGCDEFVQSSRSTLQVFGEPAKVVEGGLNVAVDSDAAFGVA